MKKLPWAAAVVAMIVAAVSAQAAPPGASGAAKASCVAAHEQAQALRTQKKLHAARDKFVACAKSDCPVVLRKECTEQMEQLEATAPTVALEALDDKGMSDSEVKVLLDGLVVSDRLTGAALPVEPGEHMFRFERSSDKKVLEQRVLVVEGEKNRKVVADYRTLLPKAKPIVDRPPPPERKPIPVLAYVAGGVALVGVGSFAFFSLSGVGKEDDLKTKCAPRCTDDDLSPIKRDYLIGDISLGIGIVAAAAAIVLALPALGGSSSVTTTAKAPQHVWMPRVKVMTQ